jgi:hypothetical protein
LEFALSSLATASDEQCESIPDDEIALLARKFHALPKFHKERRRSPWGCFECGDTTHFITDCPKRKKLNSSNEYDYTNQNDSNNKGDNKKKYHFRDKKKYHFRRSCPERVLPCVSSTSRVMTPVAQKTIRRSSARKVTSLAFASWENLQGTSPTLISV